MNNKYNHVYNERKCNIKWKDYKRRKMVSIKMKRSMNCINDTKNYYFYKTLK